MWEPGETKPNGHVTRRVRPQKSGPFAERGSACWSATCLDRRRLPPDETPREIFGPAVRYGAAALILLHNHPSGDPTPSREDIRMTRQLVECARVFDIHILDHVVIGNGTDAFTSFAERGLL